MNKRVIIVSLASLAMIATSCVIKPYKSPKNLPLSDSLYRYNQKYIDTTSNIANMPWNEFFRDSLLSQLIGRVLDNNIDMKVAQKRIQQYYSSLRVSRAAFYPTASAQVGIGMEGGEGKPIGALQGTVSSSWEIDIWGKLLSAKRSALADLLASEDARRALQTTLISQVASAYYQLIVLDTERDIVIETIKNRTEYLATTRNLKQAGKVNEVAVQQAIAQLGEVRAALPDIEMSIIQTENSLSLLFGETSQHIKRTEKVDISTIDFHQSIGYPIQILANRPDVRQAEQNFRSAFELYNVSRASLYPSLQISANGSFTELFNATSTAFSLLGGLTQPIWNGRKLRSQKEIAKLSAEQAELNFRKAILTAGQEVSNALISQDKYREKAIEQAIQLVALNKAYEYSTELFVNGYANYLDVLVAQTGVYNTQISLLNTYMNNIKSRIELYRALGGGWR